MAEDSCPECGNRLTLWQSFCPVCGYDVRAGSDGSNGQERDLEDELVAALTAEFEGDSETLPGESEFDVERLARTIVDEAVEIRDDVDADSVQEEIRVLSQELEARHDALLERLRTLKDGRPSYDRELDHVQKRFEQHRAELEMVRTDIDEFSPESIVECGFGDRTSDLGIEELRRAQEQHDKLSDRLDSLADDLDDFSAWLSDIDRRVDEIEPQVVNIETATDDLSNGIDDLERAIRSDEDGDAVTDFSTARYLDFFGELDSIEREIDDVRSTLTELDSYIANSETAHPSTEARIDELRVRLDAVAEDRTAVAADLQRLRHEYLDPRLDEFRTRNDELRERLDRLRANLPAVDRELDHVEDRFDQYRTRLSDIAESIEVLEVGIENHFADRTSSTRRNQFQWVRREFHPCCERIGDRLSELSGELDEFERWLGDVRLRVAELEETVDHLDNRAEELSGAISIFGASLNETAAPLDELEDKIESFVDERQAIENERSAAETTRAELDRRADNTGGQPEVSNRLAELEVRLEAIVTTCDRIEGDLERIRSEYLDDPEWQLARIERRVQTVDVPALSELEKAREELDTPSPDAVEARQLGRSLDRAIHRDVDTTTDADHSEAIHEYEDIAPSPGAVKTTPEEAYVRKLNSLELDVGTALTVLAGVGSAAVANDPVTSGTFILGLFGTLYDKTKSRIQPVDGFVYWVGHEESGDDDHLPIAELTEAIEARREAVSQPLELAEVDVERSLNRLERIGAIERKTRTVDQESDGETEEDPDDEGSDADSPDESAGDVSDEGKPEDEGTAAGDGETNSEEQEVVEFKMRCKSTWRLEDDVRRH